MDQNLSSLLMEGAITLDDLSGFRDDLQEKMQFLMRHYEDTNDKVQLAVNHTFRSQISQIYIIKISKNRKSLLIQ